MPKYIINTQHNGREWIATFDSYDGTSDASNREHAMGFGQEEIDAILDLIDGCKSTLAIMETTYQTPDNLSPVGEVNEKTN
jgi:hypothetical protein